MYFFLFMNKHGHGTTWNKRLQTEHEQTAAEDSSWVNSNFEIKSEAWTKAYIFDIFMF